MTNLTKYSGIYLIATGVIHNALGFIMGWSLLVGMHRDGWWNTVESSAGIQFDRSALLWFLLLGFFWMLLGYLMHVWLKQTEHKLPALLGYGFIILGGITCVILPASGAWLFILQGLIIILESLRANSNRITA